MLNGLDLFSGIGGLTIALSDWVRPVAYCEIERYASAVLLSRMSEGKLPLAPIWDDVTTLTKEMLPPVDIIYGGFPCQDISVAGLGKGLEGKRSGLFFEIMRLVDEVQPKFIFLENVPAITTRGLSQVTAEITKRGYDSRWTTLSAAEVGANHKRERWWLLAYSQSKRTRQDDCRIWQRTSGTSRGQSSSVSDTMCQRFQESGENGRSSSTKAITNRQANIATDASWWKSEPDVDRVVNGLPDRVDRIRGLGNAVVPLQAREAFKELIGFN